VQMKYRTHKPICKPKTKNENNQAKVKFFVFF